MPVLISGGLRDARSVPAPRSSRPARPRSCSPAARSAIRGCSRSCSAPATRGAEPRGDPRRARLGDRRAPASTSAPSAPPATCGSSTPGTSSGSAAAGASRPSVQRADSIDAVRELMRRGRRRAQRRLSRSRRPEMRRVRRRSGRVPAEEMGRTRCIWGALAALLLIAAPASAQVQPYGTNNCARLPQRPAARDERARQRGAARRCSRAPEPARRTPPTSCRCTAT